MSIVAGSGAFPVPDRAVYCGDGHISLEPLQRAAPPGELAGSQYIRHPPDQAVAKSCAGAFCALDDYPTIKEWMLHGEEPRPEITNFCADERSEVRCGDSAVGQLTWRKRGGTAFFCDSQRL